MKYMFASCYPDWVYVPRVLGEPAWPNIGGTRSQGGVPSTAVKEQPGSKKLVFAVVAHSKSKSKHMVCYIL